MALTYVNEIHEHGTRHSLSETFYVITHETKYGEADFFRRGLIKFNELPDNIKRLRTLSLFKTHVREFLYEQFVNDNP